MIAFDFEYHRVDSITEAVALFATLQNEGKSPLYFGGGTEIITQMRTASEYTGARALIDIKSVPECTANGFQEDHLVIGSAIPLAQLEETGLFPLLMKNASRIADHTSREKITLGGNICGHIQYKEALLPLLLTDCSVVVADEAGVHEMPIQSVFDKTLTLKPGSLIVQFLIHKHFLDLPYVSKKMTKIDRIGYPLLTVAALKMKDDLLFAFSGLCVYPFRSTAMEKALNNEDECLRERITAAVSQVPSAILDDMDASAAYRTFVLENVLEESLVELEGGKHA